MCEFSALFLASFFPPLDFRSYMFFAYILVLLLVANPALGDPFFTSLLYQTVPHHFCSRYYHRNGGMGCRTPLSGVSGILLPVDSAVSRFRELHYV